MLALISQGLTNEEVAARAFITMNTVKTYIRSTYRKINVTSRSQAVLWAVENGFKPDTLRTVDPALLLHPEHGSAQQSTEPVNPTHPPD
jgi:two-component system, NarL family, response regulator LiaR